MQYVEQLNATVQLLLLSLQTRPDALLFYVVGLVVEHRDDLGQVTSAIESEMT